jgi:phosphatidylserine decarboxylase
MKIYDRKGNEVIVNQSQNQLLKGLYSHVLGRSVLKVLTLPFITHIGGVYMNSSLSKGKIHSFIKSNNIDMSQYEEKEYQSYNDFFTRKIKENQRIIDNDIHHFISPADSKLTYYKITNDLKLNIKDTVYSLTDLLEDQSLANHYNDGICLIFRLTVDDYHRYSYIDEGKTLSYKYIKGVFHTVNPIANDYYPIYKQNSRAYSLLETSNFGNIIFMEVGAMMVGRIFNHHKETFIKGEEKGYFEFGGSTIVLLIEKDKVVIDEDIIKNSLQNIETRVLLGEKIGVKL